MSSIHDALNALIGQPNRRLSRDQLRDVAKQILQGDASAPALAAFLTALRVIGETGQEVEAFVEVMLEHAAPFPVGDRNEPVIDTCGTGGDGLHTFNISTAAALVVAASGVKVAKHGNRSASSKCGSADVLEAVGYNLGMSPEQSAEHLERHNFCFLYARSYHPSMRHAAEARQALKFRTIFNLCGPLSNPARPTHQLVGVASSDLMEPMANALRLLGAYGALVVHGSDGLDEISMSQVTEGIRLRENGKMERWHFSPSDAGLKPVEIPELVGGDAAENAQILKSILAGKKGPKSDAVAVNAGAALWLAGKEQSMQMGVSHAQATLAEGKAAALLDSIVADCGK